MVEREIRVERNLGCVFQTEPAIDDTIASTPQLLDELGVVGDPVRLDVRTAVLQGHETAAIRRQGPPVDQHVARRCRQNLEQLGQRRADVLEDAISERTPFTLSCSLKKPAVAGWLHVSSASMWPNFSSASKWGRGDASPQKVPQQRKTA